MLSDEQLALGGYRYADLLERRIISGRTDLARKQQEHGFPKPVKTGEAQALFLVAEVNEWLRQRAAKRDEAPAKPPKQISPPRKSQPSASATTPPKRKVGRPRASAR